MNPREKTLFLVIRWLYIALIAFLEPSTLFQAAMDSPWMFYLLVAQESSDSLDIRGFIDFHTTGRCCSLLHYYCHLWIYICLCTSVILVDFNVVSYWEKIVFKVTRNKWLVIRNDMINIKEGFNSSITYFPMCFQICYVLCRFNFICGICYLIIII
jgi:hypothetical protein